jgi:hypothetical protein
MVAISRLRARHPRNYHEKGQEIPQADRDRLFDICMNVAEYSNILVSTDKTQRFFWHIDFHFPWDIVIYMLSELRRPILGDKTVKAWQLIDVTCMRQYQRLGQRAKSPLHLAIANLAVKAWTAHVAECERRRVRPLPQPEILSLLWRLIQRSKSSFSQITPASSSAGQSFIPETVVTSGGSAVPSAGCSNQQSPGLFDQILNPADPSLDISTMNGLYPLDDSPLDWGQWDDLLQQFQQQSGDVELLPPFG